MIIDNFNVQGLNQEQVAASRSQFGNNELKFKKENVFWKTILSLAKEPMIILLLVVSIIYFIIGQTGDGVFLAGAVVFECIISLYQVSRSRNALEKLKAYTQPCCKVIRDGIIKEVNSYELVVGDSLIVEEGTYIAADGVIIHSNDFSVNESILTGESLAVNKDKYTIDNHIYNGTMVTGGMALATITCIGMATKLGKIGKSLEDIKEEKTPLELQINSFVKNMMLVGAFIFILVWTINFYKSHNILDSLLKALTLAMSILPEEIPVAFTSFMAIGAWRMMKMGIVVKQMKTVETLGSATVICTDKTGTITENNMSLAKLFVLQSATIAKPEDQLTDSEKELIKIAMWASEPVTFDPMEIALHNAYQATTQNDERAAYKLVHEYPLSGKPPMMTHVFENAKGDRIVATKGAPEAIIKVSTLTETEKERINTVIGELAAEGYRLLAVGQATVSNKQYPKEQQELQFTFKGIVAFYDPPKLNIKAVFEDFYNAGISVKIITGDNIATTIAIAKQIGLKNYEKCLTGDEIMQLNNAELQERVMDTAIFARMYPEAKLKIIVALKATGAIVAMTGDGINDGPALKVANIGIAMGKKGTEIAKQAASLILLQDDLSKMVDAVAMGRRIYANLKKAIQYIISIHIPIILTVLLPLLLGWVYPNIFSPIHIIFLELIMGPTCSIIFENEPIEINAMIQKPRHNTTNFFNWKELATSIIQGLAITCGTLLAYQYAVLYQYNEAVTRTMVFTVLIIANIFLTLVNRSFYYSIFTTIKYKNNTLLLIISIAFALLLLLIYLQPIAKFFLFQSLSLLQFSISCCIGFIGVIWYEVIKWWARKREQNT